MADPSPSESTTGFSGGFVGFAEKHLRDRGAAPEVPVLSTVNAEVNGMGGVGVRDSRVRRAAEGRELEGPEPSEPGGGEWLSEMVRLRPFDCFGVSGVLDDRIPVDHIMVVAGFADVDAVIEATFGVDALAAANGMGC